MSIDYLSFVDKNSTFFHRMINDHNRNRKTYNTFFDLKNKKVVSLNSPYEHENYLTERFDWAKEIEQRYEEMISDCIHEFEMNIPEGAHPEYHFLDMATDDMRFDRMKEMYLEATEKEEIYRVGFFGKNMEVGPVKKDLSDELMDFFNEIAYLTESKLRIQKK